MDNVLSTREHLRLQLNQIGTNQTTLAAILALVIRPADHPQTGAFRACARVIAVLLDDLRRAVAMGWFAADHRRDKFLPDPTLPVDWQCSEGLAWLLPWMLLSNRMPFPNETDRRTGKQGLAAAGNRRSILFPEAPRLAHKFQATLMIVNTRDQTGLYTKIWGAGRPVVLIHGWPLSADSWDDVALSLADAGFQTVAYDRRGFGRSDQPWNGYDYNNLSDDLLDLMTALNLDDATVVGFSMGGGEVARYMSRHRGKNLRSAALISSVVPYLLKTDDNPHGVPGETLDGIARALREDRPKFYESFFKDFYGVGLLSSPVSEAWLQWTRSVSMQASLRATLACAKAFGTTDFRPDLAAFQLPTLIVHGTNDQTVPIDATGRAAAAGIPQAQLLEYEDAPHGLFATHRQRLVNDLLSFLRK